MPVLMKCAQCGNDFTVKPYQAESRKWCSVKCKNEAHRVTRVCACCGKEFQIFVSQAKKTADGNSVGKFCSKACKDKDHTKPKPPKPAQKEPVYVVCKTCSKTFRVPPVRRHTAKYCSAKCKFGDNEFLEGMSERLRGELSPRWTGGDSERRGGYVITKQRKKNGYTERYLHRAIMVQWMVEEAPDHPFLVVAEDGANALNPAIVVHHIDRNRANNTKENLLALTEEAHQRIHNRGTKPQPWECWPANPDKW